MGLKSISLVVALGLVVYTRGQLDETQRTIPVGVVLRLPPESAHRELMTPIPANVHVTLVGPTRAIDRLIQTGMPPVELDLRDGQKETVFLEADMFSLPPDVEVKIIDPGSLSLQWQDVITRTIPVQASRAGQPAKSYEVRGQLEVEPKEVTVKGPASLVEVMQYARAAPFDVTGLTDGTYRRQLAIDDPPSRVRYMGPSSATVTAVIARRQTEATFQRRPIEVIGPPGARTTPRTADVTVIGEPEVVAGLRDEQVVPRVDLSSAGINWKEQRHGSTTLKVRVDLANAEAQVQPPTVTVKW
jgi:YbbR domain-containing protein